MTVCIATGVTVITHSTKASTKVMATLFDYEHETFYYIYLRQPKYPAIIVCKLNYNHTLYIVPVLGF